jgi:hypothetical protein
MAWLLQQQRSIWGNKYSDMYIAAFNSCSNTPRNIMMALHGHYRGENLHGDGVIPVLAARK